MPKHLRRLERVWIEHPIYFITTTTQFRRRILDSKEMHEIFLEVWRKLPGQGTAGLLEDMSLCPITFTFFCAANIAATTLSFFVGKWKEWTAKYANRRFQVLSPLWQAEFF